MAHETHHESGHSTEIKSKTAMSASFWFVLILAGLFIAAVNFVNVESNSKEEGEGVKTEEVHGAAGETPTAAHATAEHATEEHAAAPAGSAATTDSAAHQTADTAHAASH